MLLAPLTDVALIARVRAQDHEAFAELDRRHRPADRRSVARLFAGGPETDDVTQDTMLRAYMALRADDRPVTALRPWLLRIAHNRAIDVLRTHRAFEELPDEPSRRGEPADVLDIRDRLSGTVRALEELPHAQRRAIVLSAVQGEPFEEVTRRLDVTPEAARALAYRGRATMRRELVAA